MQVREDVPMSHVDYKKREWHPVDFKKRPCHPVGTNEREIIMV